MIVRTISTYMLGTTLLVAVPYAQANSLRPEASDVREQIRVMEQSVSGSSVTSLFTGQETQEKLELLDQAKAHLDKGQVRTALDLVERTGRMLYPVEALSLGYSEVKQEARVRQVEQAMRSVLPAAYEIARLEGTDSAGLAKAEQLLARAMHEWHGGNVTVGETLLVGAYNKLQSEVVALRSGDRLTIALEVGNTREAWQEAERRYQDWRYTADWMVVAAPALEIDPQPIDAGSRRADSIYDSAKVLARDGYWEDAVRAMDEAYSAMESAWRDAGVDI